MPMKIKTNSWDGARERFLSLKEVEYVTSLKKSTIYALVQSGEFPCQRPITLRRRAWLASEVQAWIDVRIGSGLNEEVA